jgi:hypothetical protein
VSGSRKAAPFNRSHRYHVDVSNADHDQGDDLVVAPDGSIPADQLSRLGLRPGTHLRVVKVEGEQHTGRLEGSLPEFPDINWEDFERASELAKRDVAGS